MTHEADSGMPPADMKGILGAPKADPLREALEAARDQFAEICRGADMRAGNGDSWTYGIADNAHKAIAAALSAAPPAGRDEIAEKPGLLDSNPELFNILNNALGTMHYHRLISALNWNGYQIVRDAQLAPALPPHVRGVLEHVSKMRPSPDSVGNVLAIDYARRLAQDALDALPAPPVAGADRAAVIEECAKFVEHHQERITETDNGSERSLSPRMVGNQMGLAYVTGLRALSGNERTK